MTNRKLTDKQERFSKEYLKDLNMTKAAVRAGYSKKTADRMGSRLLKNVEVKKRVNELKKGIEKKLDITIERVLRELEQIGFEINVDGRTMTMRDKTKALELIARHLGMFEKKDVDIDKEIVINIRDLSKGESVGGII